MWMGTKSFLGTSKRKCPGHEEDACSVCFRKSKEKSYMRGQRRRERGQQVISVRQQRSFLQQGKYLEFYSELERIFITIRNRNKVTRLFKEEHCTEQVLSFTTKDRGVRDSQNQTLKYIPKGNCYHSYLEKGELRTSFRFHSRISKPSTTISTSCHPRIHYWTSEWYRTRTQCLHHSGCK